MGSNAARRSDESGPKDPTCTEGEKEPAYCLTAAYPPAAAATWASVSHIDWYSLEPAMISSAASRASSSALLIMTQTSSHPRRLISTRPRPKATCSWSLASARRTRVTSSDEKQAWEPLES